jgi:hypothetical protein
MKQALPTSFLIAVLMPVFSSYSGPWEIAVHESWHSTVMSAYSWTPGGSSTLSTSRVEMASSPVQDALYHPASSVLEAVAGAGLS